MTRFNRLHWHWLSQGVRMLARDWRAGELRLLGAALALAVAAVCSVGFLSDRVGRALQQDAAQILGGDLVVQADAPLPDDWVAQAHALGLETSVTLQFPTMASTAQDARLASLKAVAGAYPLRGQLRVAGGAAGAGASVAHGPDPGEVWVDANLLAALDVNIGQAIGVGDAELLVTRTIVDEPDRGMQFVNVAPRLLLNRDDLARTGLLVEGSRVRYELAVAGAAPAIQAYTDWLAPRLARGQQLRTLENAQPNVQRTLARARSFLALVTTLTVLIAAIAVGLATRRFGARHRDGVALMRCLGTSRSQLRALLWVEFLVLGVLASVLGAALGYIVHLGLAHTASALLDATLPLPSLLPAAHGAAAGLLLLAGFAVPPLSQLARAAPVRVLRRADTGLSYGWRTTLVGLVVFLLLIAWISGEARLTAVIGLGFAAAFLIFALAAWGLIWGLDAMRHRVARHPTLHFALAGMVRRKRLAVTQLCALALGLMVLLLLALTRADLLQGWRNTLPADAPNVFLVNIQPEQRADIRARLRAAGVADPQLAPMVRGRLIAVNGKTISPTTYTDERVRRLAEREFNLSYRATLPASNQITQGRWLDPVHAEVSLEDGIAQDLRVVLGDTLRFEVAGQPVDVTVTSLRTVKWDSFDVNFFALLTPAALADAPTSFITALHLPARQATLAHDLVRAYPNLTVFDVGFIVQQLARVLDRAAAAVQGLFALTVLAGILVLGAALYATRDERIHETAILRALGASRAQLNTALHLELLLMGALAGLLAAACATATAWVLTRFVFDFPVTLSTWPWVVGVVGGMAAFVLGGRLALRGVLHTPPLAVLREVG